MADNRERGFELPIQIDYLPPKWLVTLNILLHFGAGLCVPPTSLDLYLKILLIFVIITSFVITKYRLYRQMSEFDPRKLVLDAEDRWYVAGPVTYREKITLVSGGFINPAFAVLRFLDKNKKQYVFILSSSNVNADTLRRLRVRLKFKKTPG